MQKQVVFCASSAYHLVSSIYYAQNVHWRNCKKVLIFEQTLAHDLSLDCVTEIFDEIVEIKHVRHKHSFLRRSFNLCLNQGWLFPFSPVYDLLSQEKNIALVVFSDKNPFAHNIIRYFATCGGKVILIDDGMSTYSLGTHTLRLGKKLLGLKTCNYIGESSYISTLFVRRPQDLPEIKIRNREIVLQDNFLRNSKFSAFILSLLQIDGLHMFSDIGDNSKTILWIGGPLDDIDRREEITILKNIVQLFHEYTIIIKTHPREKLGKYSELTKYSNVRILELGEAFWCPIEILINHFEPAAVLSVQSTAIANCIDIGIPSKYCYCFNLFSKITIDRSAFIPFRKHQNLFFPNTTSELFNFVTQKDVTKATFNEENARKQDINYLNRLISKATSTLS